MMASRVNLKGWQQAVVAVGSTFGALLDPIGEILLERPRVIWTQVSRAWDMPKTTFGAAYALLMRSRNFSHDDRPPVRFMETDNLAFVATRARESCMTSGT
ncbi:Ubiquinone biosynthesis COQ4-like protein [Hordeum vulgare]|nr:Ubiquinone biosynthesis COQ4-like protein [Hordeum vulgare]